MNFRKVNNIAGWIVCAIASLVFILTTEKSGSFWDTGEFTAAAFKVQMPHPPGAPLFVLIGRLFIILFGGDGSMAAKAVNIMNALASGFTVLFLFWTITHFARKLTIGFKEEPDSGQVLTIIGAGLVGGWRIPSATLSGTVLWRRKYMPSPLCLRRLLSGPC
jgi:hypothetical protein